MRGLERPQLARRRGQPRRRHERVEAPVPRRGLARRAGRGEAADRRVLERLREMAQGDSGGVERGLGLGAAQARPEPCGERAPVDLDVAHAREVERHEALELAAVGIDAPDDARAAAEGDDRDALFAAGGEDARDLLGVGGKENRVGRAREARRAAAGSGRGSSGRPSGGCGPRGRSAPRRGPRRRARCSGSGLGSGSLTCARSTGGVSWVAPTSASSSAIASADSSGWRSAGPHPHHFVS